MHTQGNTSLVKNQHVVWLDVIRLAAFLCLLCCHAADPFNAAATYGGGDAPTDLSYPIWGAIWGSLVRPCVPLFVMITGALSLPVKLPMNSFYHKRILRVLWPFLLWSVIYNLFPWFTGILGLPSSSIYDFFVWAESDSQSLSTCLKAIALIPIHFNAIACHMWYIYLLIGLYLYLPIFSAWVEKATRRQKELVLILWIASTLLPYIREYVTPYAFGTCSWNEFGLLYYFAGFNGYLLLGHYLRFHTFNSKETTEDGYSFGLGKALLIAIPIFMIGFLITWRGFVYICALPKSTPEQIELFWTYNSINVVMMTFAIFIVLQRIRIGSEQMRKMLQNLTLCGFGIYMIHYFFVGPSYALAVALHIPIPIIIPFCAICILAASWSIIALIKGLFGNKSRYFIG